MVIWVFKCPSERYKIRKIFGQKSTYTKENIVFCELTYCWGGNKYQNWTFKDNCLPKIIRIFLKKEFIEKYEIMSTFFDNFNLWSTSFSKLMPNFWRLATMSIQKIQYFPLSKDLWAKNYLILYPSLEKLNNP